MLIPKGGDVYTASVYMNYVYDPKVQGLMEAGDPKRDITGIYYIPPVKGAAVWAKKFNPPIGSNPLIFPTAETLDKMHSLRQRRAEQREVRDRVGQPHHGVAIWDCSTAIGG